MSKKLYYKREISVEEMPQGCILSMDRGCTIYVSSPDDALVIIESLKRMLRIQHTEIYYENKSRITNF